MRIFVFYDQKLYYSKISLGLMLITAIFLHKTVEHIMILILFVDTHLLYNFADLI